MTVLLNTALPEGQRSAYLDVRYIHASGVFHEILMIIVWLSDKRMIDSGKLIFPIAGNWIDEKSYTCMKSMYVEAHVI